MSRSGILLTVLFLGLGLFSAARSFFPSDPAPPPAPVQDTTPSPSPEASLSPEASPSPEVSPTEVAKLEPFPTFEGPRPKPQAYDTTQDLAAALADKGIECTNLDFLEQDNPTLKEFSLCDPGTANRRFNIYFYDSAANRKLWIGLMKSQKLPLPLVYGPNWIIVAAGEPSTAMKRIEAIAGALGGRIQDFSPNNA